MDYKQKLAEVSKEKMSLQMRLQAAQLSFESSCLTSNEELKAQGRAELHTLQDMLCDVTEQLYYFIGKSIEE